ncbi:radical SAM/SPASM domain-containing protein [Bradyrhizobium sp. LA6.12]|uniref:radical SAM/SPASM domain-containing protein n=2 Tax=unclassified Bradyrhizobium TaxID=2631580 RepID=UPI003390C799
MRSSAMAFGAQFLSDFRAARVTPTNLVLNVTLKCPLKCSHCCFSSDMFHGGHLSAADVHRCIQQAAQIPSMEIIHFVGGDPMLHADIVADAVALAASLGLRAGITTSAFWAKSPARATAAVRQLRAAGLTEMTLSYDDPHAEFVPLNFIANAVAAARECGLLLRIAVVVEAGSKITAASLRADLGLQDEPGINIYETVANSTGRGEGTDEDTQAGRVRHASAYRGPCESVLHTVTVDHEGGIRPCCGVLPHYDSLKVGHIAKEGIEAAMQAAADDPLYRWIRLEGPVAILAAVTAADPVPMRVEDFDGICTACDRIFRSPELLARVREAAEARRGQIETCEILLDGQAASANLVAAQ